MENVDPRTMPRMLHIIPMHGKYRVGWSDGRKALRWLPDQQRAIRYAKDKSGGVYSVIVHKPSGFADVNRSIVISGVKAVKTH
ncbi:MAG: hypothetical protein ABL974_05345 [Prosthecobacter sp.]